MDHILKKGGSSQMFENKKIIIFDMDGTLIDSIGIWNQVDIALISRLKAGERISEREVQERRDAVLRQYSSAASPYMEYCRILKEKYASPMSADVIHTLRYEIAQDFLRHEIDYKEDAELLLKELKQRGFLLVIASTTRRKNMDIYREENENIREKAAIDEIFSAVYTREDAHEIKPHPEIYLRVLDDFHAVPEETLVFEDSLIGLEAAKSAGLETVAVYDRYSDPDREQINWISDHCIDSFAEAVRYLQEEGTRGGIHHE